MAVYTHVSDDALIEFLTQYDIGEFHTLKGIAEGVENSNYLLGTDSGFFFLTLYEKRVAPNDLPFFLGLMQHLVAKGVNCPQPIRMKNGKNLGMLAGRPAAIISFLYGNSIRRPLPSHCHMLGAALATMHLAGGGFEIKRENALGPKDWQVLFEKSGSGADSVDTGLRKNVANELRYLLDNWPAGLPEGIIHADLFPDNVLFLKQQLSGVIDFYFACNDILAFDIAICINAWCFESDMAFNVTKAAALLAGYQGVKPLRTEEIDALPILCRGAALRFLLTRLYDWLNVREGALVIPKDPGEYIDKLKFHQSVSRPSEYGLDLS